MCVGEVGHRRCFGNPENERPTLIGCGSRDWLELYRVTRFHLRNDIIGGPRVKDDICIRCRGVVRLSDNT